MNRDFSHNRWTKEGVRFRAWRIPVVRGIRTGGTSPGAVYNARKAYKGSQERITGLTLKPYYVLRWATPAGLASKQSEA